MIQIKSFFSKGWKNVDKETAIRFVKNLLDGITTMNKKEKVEWINKTRLKGTTVQELLGEKCQF